MKKTAIFIFLFILTINLNAQDSKIDRFSYSLSWTPIYYGPNDGEFRLDAIIPITLEATIHYKIVNRFAIASGIGFQNWHNSYLSWGYLSVIDPSKSERWCTNVLRLPIQITYFLTKDDKYLIPYFKSELVNEFGHDWIKRYQDNNVVFSDSYKTYSNTLDFGFGTLMRITNSLRLITEGSIGTHLHNYPFDGYQIKLKVGIMIK